MVTGVPGAPGVTLTPRQDLPLGRESAHVQPHAIRGSLVQEMARKTTQDPLLVTGPLGANGVSAIREKDTGLDPVQTHLRSIMDPHVPGIISKGTPHVQMMEIGVTGDHGDQLILGLEKRQEPDFVITLRPQMEERPALAQL